MFKYRISFSINYRTNYGEFLALTGSDAQLGSWNLDNSIIMKWNENHIWTAKMFMYHNYQHNCEYKYVLCKEEQGKIIPIRWEDGPNRIVTFSKIKKLTIKINDEWTMRKIIFQMPDNLCNNYKMKIVGSIPAMGNGKFYTDMKKICKKNSKSYFWKAEFLIPYSTNSIKYTYQIEDTKKGFILQERASTRKININFANCPNLNLNKNYENDRIAWKNNTIKIMEKEFQNEFKIDQITSKILLGPCPQSKDEVKILADTNINGVLNLQRGRDMLKRGIDWDELKKCYIEKDIDIINYQIKDKSPDKIAEELFIAAEILNNMLKKHDKVYIHCTAGKNRSPAVVMIYLYLYENYTLEKTFEIMRKKRPMAYINRTSLESVIKLRKHWLQMT